MVYNSLEGFNERRDYGPDYKVRIDDDEFDRKNTNLLNDFDKFFM